MGSPGIAARLNAVNPLKSTARLLKDPRQLLLPAAADRTEDSSGAEESPL